MGRGKDGFDALMGTRRGEGPATVTRRAAEREAEIDRLASLQVGTSETISGMTRKWSMPKTMAETPKR